MKKAEKIKKIEIIQIKSSIGIQKKHRAVLKSLGLSRLGKKRIHDDSSSIRGAINKINHLITVNEVNHEAK